jgi:hypothetical protein
MTIKTFSLTIIIICCLFAVPALSQNDKTELIRVFTELNRVYGFCEGQSLSLNTIEKEFPELRNATTTARLEWNTVFGKSCEAVEDKLSPLLADEWIAHKDKIQTALRETLSKNQISRNDAIGFLEIVKKRTKGDIPSPMLEMLLIFNPNFIANPVAEMSQGFKRTFRTGNHPKAKGVDFQIEYPMSWTPKEGIRPNIIQNIQSDNGFGESAIMLMVKDIPQFNGRKLTNKGKALMFAPTVVKNLIPAGKTFISAKPIVLDGQKGAMLVFDEVSERVDRKMRTRNVQFVTAYADKMIMINCLMGVLDGPLAKLNERHKRLEPLFKAVANSFVIQSQYK